MKALHRPDNRVSLPRYSYTYKIYTKGCARNQRAGDSP